MTTPGVPGLAGRLIDVLIQRGNVSGSVRPAPHELRNLKDAIAGTPFQLLTPAMSGVLTTGNLSSMIQALSKMPGLSLSELGQLQPLLSQLLSITPAQAQQAMGAGAALGAALLAYGGAAGSVQSAAAGRNGDA